MSKLADDPRIDPRIKVVLALLPDMAQTDVESREALLEAVNRPEAVAEREQMTAAFERR
jgi:acetyl esterase